MEDKIKKSLYYLWNECEQIEPTKENEGKQLENYHIVEKGIAKLLNENKQLKQQRDEAIKYIDSYNKSKWEKSTQQILNK